MRHLIPVVLIVAMLFCFMVSPAAAGQDLLVGISKIVAHPALDSLEQGVQDGIRERFPKARFDLQNANGELSTAASIAQKFKSQGVDLAVGIATPTAQALVGAMRSTPVVFCAVTDPVGAGLVYSTAKGEKNVTGTSDMTPVREQIALLNQIKPLKTLGHVYCNSEANAVALAVIARKVAEDMGIRFIETTVTNSAEVMQAVQTIAARVDGIYLSNDNTVFSALPAVTRVAMKHKIPVMSADPSSAETNDVLAAWGFDYYKMGKVTGRIAARVLAGELPETIPTMFMTDPSDVDLLINMDVADRLGLTFPSHLVEKANTIIQNGQAIKK